MTAPARVSRVAALVVLGVFWVLFWTWYVTPADPRALDDLDAGGRFALTIAIGMPGAALTAASLAVTLWCVVRPRGGATALIWLCAALVGFMVWSYSNLTSSGLEIDARFGAAMVLTWLALAAAFLGRRPAVTQCYVRSPGVQTPGECT